MTDRTQEQVETKLREALRLVTESTNSEWVSKEENRLISQISDAILTVGQIPCTA